MGKGSQNKLLDESSETTENDSGTATTTTVSSSSVGTEISSQVKYYDWDEIKKHNRPDDTWLVVDNIIYDITKFKRTHPGGFRILELYGGQDGTEPFYAFHKDLKQANVIRKYMKEVGRVDPNSVNNSKEAQIKRDFDELRKLAIEKGLFKPSYTFFLLTGLHIWFLHLLGYWVLWHYSYSWIGCTLSLFFLVVAQVQAGWNQHDYGHSSLFGKASWNRHIQGLFIGAIKGASPEWWARTHNMHHAKPNVVNKDPDIIVDPIFVFGTYNIQRRAEKNAKSKSYLYPYDYQHWVFPLIAPTLFTFYFPVKTFHFVIRSRRFSEFYYMFPYYFLNCLVTYVAFQSVQKAILFTLLVRAFDSTWFFAVSQCNHITMQIHTDIHNDNWLNLQLTGTCNLESSPFKDWFTGHLNYQIEHHLFPTMPRHNFKKIQPYVQELCKKHNINYYVKPMGQALGEIFSSIKNFGEMWREAYEELRAEN